MSFKEVLGGLLVAMRLRIESVEDRAPVGHRLTGACFDRLVAHRTRCHDSALYRRCSRGFQIPDRPRLPSRRFSIVRSFFPGSVRMAESPQSLMQQAVNAFSKGDLAKAGQLSDRLVVIAPRDVNVWLLRGRVTARMSRWDLAEEALDRAATLAPKEGEVPFARAMIRMRQGRMAEAVDLLAKTELLKPNHPEARSARAECLRQMGEPKRALELLGRSPKSPSQAITISEALADIGDLVAAEKVLRDAMQWDLGNSTPKQHMMRRLGEIKESQGDYTSAFDCYRRSRDGIPSGLDAAAAKREFGRIVKEFTAEAFRSVPVPTIHSRRPFFIVGMPRSGTTLLEKMIAAHPHGAGGGETNAFLSQVMRFAKDPDPSRRWPEFMGSLTAADLDGIASGYLEQTESFVAPGVERVADKQLQNWVFAGLIAAVFPDATMVHLRRDPFDTGISCFERLVPAAMPWCADLTHVGQMLAINEWVMEHWRVVMPGRMIEIRYESLARAPEATLRPLLEATGLAWDDACLRQHERKHVGLREPPPTLSADQVKRPVYDTSIGRAERFGAVLEPMRVAYRAMRSELGLAPLG